MSDVQATRQTSGSSPQKFPEPSSYSFNHWIIGGEHGHRIMIMGSSLPERPSGRNGCDPTNGEQSMLAMRAITRLNPSSARSDPRQRRVAARQFVPRTSVASLGPRREIYALENDGDHIDTR